jgi:hypothetical protein
VVEKSVSVDYPSDVAGAVGADGKG